MTEMIFDKNEDWEARTLCSNESCIGVIGLDGKCTECGKSYDGTLNKATPCADGAPGGTDVNALPDQEITKDSASVDIVSDEEWEKRVLCGDESCIGVIGHDGKCTECGKPGSK
jgi:hypothetical protein